GTAVLGYPRAAGPDFNSQNFYRNTVCNGYCIQVAYCEQVAVCPGSKDPSRGWFADYCLLYLALSQLLRRAATRLRPLFLRPIIHLQSLRHGATATQPTKSRPF